jgi:hypothetical protein
MPESWRSEPGERREGELEAYEPGWYRILANMHVEAPPKESLRKKGSPTPEVPSPDPEP